MLYVLPDYYPEFHCTAGECEDTCCVGWQIVIDEQSLKRYRAIHGPAGRRLLLSVRWGKKIFRQDKEKRCAFLNENNLCDLYTFAGKDSLCRTCRLYPRHIEEFENVREISLSVSCPEAARLLLYRKEPLRFVEISREGKESYEEFDELFYSQLCRARETMLAILQDRKRPLELRCCLIAGLANDLEKRWREGKLFSWEDLLEAAEEGRYDGMALRKLQKAGKQWKEGKQRNVGEQWNGGKQWKAEGKQWKDGKQWKAEGRQWKDERQWKAEGKLRKQDKKQIIGNMDGVRTDKENGNVQKNSSFEWNRCLLKELEGFEHLREDWPLWLEETKDWLYKNGQQEYDRIKNEFYEWMEKQEQDWQLPFEQLLVYFLYTYFCGSVYDGRIRAAVQLGIAHVGMLRDMLMACWLRNQKTLDLEDLRELVCRYSRELEHSDINQRAMEQLMIKWRLPWLEPCV